MILRMNQPKDKATVISYIEKLPDQQYIVTIEKKKVKRTVPQNKLYWLWINCIAKETGNEANDLHDYFGDKWLPKDQVQMFNNELHVRQRSTTQLTTVQFKEYLDKIQMFASAELGLILPNPEDKFFDEMMDHYSNLF